MTMKTTIGGNRLGSGKRMQVDLKTYNRSTHDLSYIWRSTMSAGTLVPFMNEVVLPGDTIDINLDCDVKTHPTIGPLFGSFKVQLDVFTVPFRLYQPQLYQDKLGIGLNMASVKLAQVTLEGNEINPSNGDINTSQVNPSSIFAYLGIAGLGRNHSSVTPAGKYVTRKFCAHSWIAYWDIFKNYYADKQLTNAAVIHTPITVINKNVEEIMYYQEYPGTGSELPNGWTGTGFSTLPTSTLIINNLNNDDFDSQSITLIFAVNSLPVKYSLSDVFAEITQTSNTVQCAYIRSEFTFKRLIGWEYADKAQPGTSAPKITMFPLDQIDRQRQDIIAAVNSTNAFDFIRTNANIRQPFNLALQAIPAGDQLSIHTAIQYSQEGLALKTYQSDVFNNWMKTEWITGTGSISAVTAVSTAGGSFTVDALIMAKKVYEMLTAIAISGGSYYDYINATYDHYGMRTYNTPVYVGGLIRELAFQEVVSNAQAGEDPLGTLAGKGIMTNKRKGGRIRINVDEHATVIGIVSLTPRIDYSQGNRWHMNLTTMDDFHKPALDGIGFQDLITDQMAFWDTQVNATGTSLTYQSAGKQPAWINYMTNYNRCYGNFADPEAQMFMTLNRRYEYNPGASSGSKIKDLTTYIDPTKFNYIFAQTSLDAQNFWVQIAVDMIARRKMSAKIIPNL